MKYIDLVTEQLSYLPENIVIERLTGDGNVDDLVAPDWSIKKVTILNDIDKLMVKKYVQGCNLVQKRKSPFGLFILLNYHIKIILICFN